MAHCGRPSDMANMPEGRATAEVHRQEYRKASIRAKVELNGLAKNTAHVITLFAFSNL